ncbi:hypothetical protein U9M48_007799 [Paspalum notatum var. saurae]|uniref:Membrane insertase YidC/Oxa/ALB C-terminal domain-containing protein n=1 Tax=Paspalum notatum var. saurae TaxID=547442 RepID=A0AAQ3WCB3_PASNO
MAFAARRSIATRLSHHLTRRLHPCAPHALTSSHSHDEQASPSPPLPPLHAHASLQHSSRAAQNLCFLPFSLHLAGPARRGFSSSAPGPAFEAAPAAEVDATAVLVDAAEAAAPAPFPGEVAAAAADSFFPVAALQHVIDAIHSFTGLNWWVSIALTTLIIRSATIPLLVKQMKATLKLKEINPEMQAIKDQMTMDPTSAREGQAKMKALFKKHGVSPFTPLKGALIQGPIFMSFYFAVSNMVEKVPSLKGGGTLWFTDLTTPDSLYILPVLTGLTFLATVELNLQEGMQDNPMADTALYHRFIAAATAIAPHAQKEKQISAAGTNKQRLDQTPEEEITTAVQIEEFVSLWIRLQQVHLQPEIEDAITWKWTSDGI